MAHFAWSFELFLINKIYLSERARTTKPQKITVFHKIFVNFSWNRATFTIAIHKTYPELQKILQHWFSLLRYSFFWNHLWKFEIILRFWATENYVDSQCNYYSKKKTKKKLCDNSGKFWVSYACPGSNSTRAGSFCDAPELRVRKNSENSWKNLEKFQDCKLAD